MDSLVNWLREHDNRLQLLGDRMRALEEALQETAELEEEEATSSDAATTKEGFKQ